MSSGLRKIVVALAVLVAGWVAFDAWNEDERRIGRRLAELQELAARSPLETQLQGAANAKKIADLFAGDFELKAESHSFATSHRQDLIRAIISHRARTDALAVAISREDLFVDPGGRSATHYAYVEFLNELADLRSTESYPVKIEWVEEGGDWMIRKLELLPEERP